MLADEADTVCSALVRNGVGNFGLTILAADLSWSGNDEFDSQWNYDYQAHAHVYHGGADPLGSQGFASVVKTSFKLLDAAREAKSSRAFLFMGQFFKF